MGNTIVSFLIVIGILIFFHELGHFIVARIFDVRVEKFSLGFGPRLIGKTIGSTEYRISALPIGGYVKMFGENPYARIDTAAYNQSFTHKTVARRMMIVAAGPVFNILLAIIIFFGVFWVNGKYVLKPSVGAVYAGSAAAKAGVLKGDLITAIDGRPVDSWDAMVNIIHAGNGKAVGLSVQRQKSKVALSVTPQKTLTHNIYGEEIERFLIGIEPLQENYLKRMGPVDAFVASLGQSYRIVELMFIVIFKILTGAISVDAISGPIMIAQFAGESARGGWGMLIAFIGLISINLGVVNLLPIPLLDGGHLTFFLIEAIKGRPVSKKTIDISQRVGMAVLILLMVLAFHNDLKNLTLK